MIQGLLPQGAGAPPQAEEAASPIPTPTQQENPPQNGSDSSEQELFDHLLAKGMKLLYNEKVIKDVIKNVAENPVEGLVLATKSIIDKIRSSGKEQSKPIPGKMLPAMSLEIMSQIAEITGEKSGTPIGEDTVIQAFEQLATEEYKMGLKNGSIKEEELASMVKAMQGGKEQQAPDTQQSLPSQEVPQAQPPIDNQMGGLLQ